MLYIVDTHRRYKAVSGVTSSRYMIGVYFKHGRKYGVGSNNLFINLAIGTVFQCSAKRSVGKNRVNVITRIGFDIKMTHITTVNAIYIVDNDSVSD